MVKELDRKRGIYHFTVALLMSIIPSINPQIVESLYAEAVALADELRARFGGLRGGQDCGGRDCSEDERLAISCEALRVTNRMTHCMTWLLNHRAYLRGELSALQLRRQGRILDTGQSVDARVLAHLPTGLQSAIGAANEFYLRIARLDKAWRLQERANGMPPVLENLRERIATSMQASAG